MNEIAINIVIAERHYKLTVDRNDEEKVRKAAAMINEKLKNYSKGYAFKDVQDHLAMTALQFATTTLSYESSRAYKDQYLEQKLRDIDALLNSST